MIGLNKEHKNILTVILAKVLEFVHTVEIEHRISNFQKNAFPIKHIHKEFLNIESCLKENDFDKIVEVCKPYFNPKYCLCVLKTGKSKGQQCRKYKSSDSNFCHIHKKKYEEFCVNK